MEVFRILMMGLALVSGILLVAGLFSPVLVLWWMDYQNRLRVLRIYGSIFLISLLIWVLV